ncbi:hypothetical protein DPMN_077135 [Dreissena polymorpha]|uniref:Uncharacterized protein n=1 Tax=Dreissena polymorpha TaxID=45954 RepID=A0A9D3YPE4_DREPO|nr:hypothetical protein DPMN_077135 [Dreissena polymorpha]
MMGIQWVFSPDKPVMEEKILKELISVGHTVVTAFVVTVIFCCRIKRYHLLSHFEAYVALPRLGTEYICFILAIHSYT